MNYWGLFLLLGSLIKRSICKLTNEVPITAKAQEMRLYLDRLSREGRIIDTIDYLSAVKEHYGHLRVDDNLPSLYSFLGVALYTAKRLEEAMTVMKEGLQFFPNETRAWINLGEIQIQKFALNDAAESFTNAFRLGEYSALPRIIRTKGWSLSWQSFETYCVDLERFANDCLKDVGLCIIETSSGFEYTQADYAAFKVLTSLAPNSQLSMNPVPSHKRATIWEKSNDPQRKLKVGFVSSDFGIHPVATLIRGLLQFLSNNPLHQRNRLEVHCFSLQNAFSWWGGNVSAHIGEHFHVLESKNLHEAAEYIASFSIEILIDLNGHTMFSGLPIFSFVPAPLQISYLGLPTTTAADFIDYYISDYITIPTEQVHHFSERLLLMKPCYIANDYAQVQGAVAITNLFQRADRQALIDSIDLSKASIILSSLSNSQKMDPRIFHVWMNIMHRFAGSKLLIVEYAGQEVYRHHLANHGRHHGIGPDRLINIPQAPWIDHLFSKTAIDLVLDTIAKNAHTTGLDGIWAGVPTITLAGGSNALSRAGESIATALESDLGLTYSLKDYEDLAFSLLRKKKYSRKYQSIVSQHHQPEYDGDNDVSSSLKPQSPATAHLRLQNEYHPPKSLHSYNPIDFITHYPVLVSWRRVIYRQRLLSPLFNTPQFSLSFQQFLEAAWECAHLQKHYSSIPSIAKKVKYHLFPVTSSSSSHSSPASKENDRKEEEELTVTKPIIHLHQVYADQSDIIPKSLIKKLNQQFNNRSLILSDGINHFIQKYVAAKRSKKGEMPSGDFTTKDDTIALKTHSKSPSTANSQRKTLKRKEGAHHHDEKTKEDSEFVWQEKGASKKILYPAIPSYVFDGRNIMLNIGGVRNAQGWLNVNTKRINYNLDGNIDILRPMHDLKGIPNNSVAAVYSSHTLEHSSFGDQMVMKTLREWFRVLRPGGILLIGVPDLSVLARMYLDPSFTAMERWIVTHMIYGGQSDEGDYHHVGFDESLLRSLLLSVGFCNVTRVSAFNLGFYDPVVRQQYYDTSEKFFKQYFISLNMVAKVCPESKLSSDQLFDGFSIDHNALPYFGYRLPPLDPSPSPSTSRAGSKSQRKRGSSSSSSVPPPPSYYPPEPDVHLTKEQIEGLHIFFQNHSKE